MKAVVLNQIGRVDLQDFPEPRIIDEKDAIVRVTTAGICGSDLHIIHGRDPGIRMGTIMGHEFTGLIEDAGSGITELKRGDRVVSPFSINCGACFYCARNLPARCVHSLGFGFINEEGRGLHGTQTEYVRVPFASSTLMQVPERRSDNTQLPDEEILFLGDIFSTAYATAEGANIQQGDTVAVVGCGPVGLLCIRAAQLLHAANIVAFDTIDYRLQKAHSMGALAVNANRSDAHQLIQDLTSGRGADAALEAVGAGAALDLAISLVRPGATVSIAGYHTTPTYNFPIHAAYGKNLTVRIGRCSARKYMPRLLPYVLNEQVSLTEIITHVLPLSDAIGGYDIFSNRVDGAIKVLLKP